MTHDQDDNVFYLDRVDDLDRCTWEHIISWTDHDAEDQLALQETPWADCLTLPHGVRFESTEEIPDDEVDRLLPASGWCVPALARLCELRGWQVNEMWENAPDRDRGVIELRNINPRAAMMSLYGP